MVQWKCSDASCDLQDEAPLAVSVAQYKLDIGIKYAVECRGCKKLCFPCHVCRGLIAIENAHSGLLVCFQCGSMEVLDKPLRKCLRLPPLAFEDAIEDEARQRSALHDQLKALEEEKDDEDVEKNHEKIKQLQGKWYVNGEKEDHALKQEKINLTMLKLLPSTSEASQDEKDWLTSTIESFFHHRQLLSKLQEEARQAMLLESRLYQEKQYGALALEYSKQHWKAHSEHFEGITQPYWQMIGKANAQLRRLYATAVELASKETKCEKPQVLGWVNPRNRRRQQLLSAAPSPPDNAELATVAEEIHLWRNMCITIALACLPPTL
ncbi:hypothetical protein THRCLA_05166 [Thraustotheca clavata]|uniref:Uncharacterized protein n=1 Tax=Thraustotheca clavata TaxID=74557 RepID=A0A1V9ZWR5_9STRA|nr:hypothetical protein THRCLA_05166 [Thraustotheca clavata]